MFKLALLIPAVALTALITGCGGGGDNAPTETSVPGSPSAPTPAPGPLSANIDRTKSQWYISTSTSPVDAVKTTLMFAAGPDGADFYIYCKSTGERGYYIRTSFVTGSGYVKYRVGHNAVQTQTWTESPSAGYQVLHPPSFDINLLKQLYQNWDFETQLSRYGVGLVNIGFRIVGFPAAIDRTRAACGWSNEMFPPNNGWFTEYPDIPPSNAVEASYEPTATSQFGLIAWRAINPSGRQQLLVRLGENKALCKGSFVINDTRIYVIQDGRRVSAVSGTEFSLSCGAGLPATFALQGDFDASRPLTINAYSLHFNTTDPGTPFAALTLN